MPTNRLLVQGRVATYANTLFEAANEDGQDRVLEVRDQLEQIVSLFHGNADLRDALDAPNYTAEQRGSMAEAVFAGVDPLLISVLKVMAEREEVKLLPRVWHMFSDLVEEKLNVAVVGVTTVVDLDDELRAFISDKLKNDLGRNIVLREHIDPSILGGIIITTQGKRIDASVASKLANARTVLTESNDGGEC
ncbi:ATP synthase F1 subunit delta [Slackia heliotrinireducens]|jgi:F-type H+-transporting ATPase subunit delta|uniref:ATP synthase subunit delta n=1 Tax=Slackia heliotrinireducens (strain ATCC 29202 / DSM 20476 / NCTC 11029 / RHS 1) TaxID=471855 RepID=C7N8B8_SLAHD|nr:ATP synthase F1 subunit delta [Slackia heliotrinireducens]ACV23153.1 ATP synthase, F1 delta subunit [Slackia heliotrinireducens DSM 20476]VEH02202.1 F-type ATPase subunit delta [Slackia heliotrinireducens]